MTAICAACGAAGPSGAIRCLECGQPLMFAKKAHGDAAEAMELVAAIRPLLAGKSEFVQGAALADLLATWLAGHVHLGDPKETRKARKQMLKMHLVAVEGLIDINYKMSVEPQIKAKMQ
jgi:hypothetical protein